ncbi:hypothetical protein EON64_04645, partial [archaeon]
MLQGSISKVLILAPLAVLPGWERELTNSLVAAMPQARVEVMNSEVSKKKRVTVLREVFDAHAPPTLVVSTHQLTVTMTADFTAHGTWDYVILDEGHVIKNPATKLSKAMHSLQTRHRLLLTGTPLQNNLTEFWAVMDWATGGQRMGSRQAFRMNIDDPIT